MALKFVNQSVSTVFDGRRVLLTRDDPWRDDDPVVVGLSQFFSDEPSDVKTSVARVFTVAPVEQATAAPDEKRSTRRSSKS